MILNIRTDKDESYISLSRDYKTLVEDKWQAHRELSDNILARIKNLLDKQSLKWNDIDGVNVFKGPGSFTGLRIGITVANTLAESLKVAVIGSDGDDWQKQGGRRLIVDGGDDKIVVPMYGAEANITTPRK